MFQTFDFRGLRRPRFTFTLGIARLNLKKANYGIDFYVI